MTITIGAWVIPLAITIAALGWTTVSAFKRDGGTYGVGHLLSLAAAGVAIIVSLVAWLVWAVLT